MYRRGIGTPPHVSPSFFAHKQNAAIARRWIGADRSTDEGPILCYLGAEMRAGTGLKPIEVNAVSHRMTQCCPQSLQTTVDSLCLLGSIPRPVFSRLRRTSLVGDRSRVVKATSGG